MGGKLPSWHAELEFRNSLPGPMNFQIQHLSTLSKYVGISFVVAVLNLAFTHQATASTEARTVAIDMNDKLRFNPASWEATEGEDLRLVVTNSGKVRHELVIGKEKELAEHAKQMREAHSGHHHHMNNAVSVEPGQSAVLNWTFKSPGTWGMACFEPGHFEAGMAGQITVKPKHSH